MPENWIHNNFTSIFASLSEIGIYACNEIICKIQFSSFNMLFVNFNFTI